MAEVLNFPDADRVDMLACVAFCQAPFLTCAKRAEQFRERQVAWSTSFQPGQRIVLEALLEKNRLGKGRSDDRSTVFPPASFQGNRRTDRVIKRLSGTESLRQALAEL